MCPPEYVLIQLIIMITIFLVSLLFFCAIVVHIILCRASSDKNLKSKLFLQISLSFLVLFIVLVIYFCLPFLWSCVVIYILLIPAYLVVYVTTVLVSPSKKILMSLSGSSGLSYEGILVSLQKENLISSRLEELVQSGCVVLIEGRFQLTPTGKSLATFLDLYGRILGRGVGG